MTIGKKSLKVLRLQFDTTLCSDMNIPMYHKIKYIYHVKCINVFMFVQLWAHEDL